MAHSRPRLSGVVVCGATYCDLVLTNSRGPLLAFTAGAGILLLKRLKTGTATVLMSFVLVTSLLIIGLAENIHTALVTLQATDNVIVRRMFRDQTPDQVPRPHRTGRALGQVASLRLSEPIAGYGYQGSRRLLLETADWAGAAHNGLMQTLLDVGIAGAICLVPPLVFVIFRDFRGRIRPMVRWEQCAAHAAIVFLFFNSITHDSFAAPGGEVLVLFTSVSVLSRLRLIDRNHAKAPDQN